MGLKSIRAIPVHIKNAVVAFHKQAIRFPNDDKCITTSTCTRRGQSLRHLAVLDIDLDNPMCLMPA